MTIQRICLILWKTEVVYFRYFVYGIATYTQESVIGRGVFFLPIWPNWKFSINDKASSWIFVIFSSPDHTLTIIVKNFKIKFILMVRMFNADFNISVLLLSSHIWYMLKSKHSAQRSVINVDIHQTFVVSTFFGIYKESYLPFSNCCNFSWK